MMREYVRRRQAKIAEYIAGRTMYKQCTGAERIKVSSRFLIWWDQEHGLEQVETEVRLKRKSVYCKIIK